MRRWLHLFIELKHTLELIKPLSWFNRRQDPAQVVSPTREPVLLNCSNSHSYDFVPQHTVLPKGFLGMVGVVARAGSPLSAVEAGGSPGADCTTPHGHSTGEPLQGALMSQQRCVLRARLELWTCRTIHGFGRGVPLHKGSPGIRADLLPLSTGRCGRAWGSSVHRGPPADCPAEALANHCRSRSDGSPSSLKEQIRYSEILVMGRRGPC